MAHPGEFLNSQKAVQHELRVYDPQTWVQIDDLFSPGCVDLDRGTVLPTFKFSHLQFGDHIRKVPGVDQPLLFLLLLLCVVALTARASADHPGKLYSSRATYCTSGAGAIFLQSGKLRRWGKPVAHASRRRAGGQSRFLKRCPPLTHRGRLRSGHTTIFT